MACRLRRGRTECEDEGPLGEPFLKSRLRSIFSREECIDRRDLMVTCFSRRCIIDYGGITNEA